MITKYAIAWVGNDGYEQCERADDYLYKDRQKAEQALKDTLANNNHNKLKSVYGDLFIKTARIVPVKCYDNGAFFNRIENHRFRVGDKVEVYADGRKFVRKIVQLYSDIDEGYKVDKPCPPGTEDNSGFVSWNAENMKLLERA